MSENLSETSGLADQEYWKLCTIVLGLMLLVSLSIHAGGPARATAVPMVDSKREVDPDRRLQVGGFALVDGGAAFIIRDENGTLLGALPMTATAGINEGS